MDQQKVPPEETGRQTAIRFLLMAAEGRLPVMFAHIALLKALNAGKPKPAPAARKKGRQEIQNVAMKTVWIYPKGWCWCSSMKF
jgi:hypothetical protein